MTTKHNQSEKGRFNSNDDLLNRYISERVDKAEEKRRPKRNFRPKRLLRVVLIVLIGFFLLRTVSNFSITSPFTSISTVFNPGPSEELLNRMGAWMDEMGYTGLSHDELRGLRDEGVTAT